jgi:molybdate transport system substrate-binding protein
MRRRYRNFFVGILCAIIALLALQSDATPASEPVSIAAASDLAFCLDALNAAFKRTHPGATLKVSTGSSGNFFAQIKNGAPYDLFLAADMSYPRELTRSGCAEESSLFQYAVGRIVLWTVKTNLALTNGLLVLRDPAIRRIAIANPEHAPYGRAARAALEHFKLWETVQTRLVLGENISQAAQFVQTGNADVGIIALSLVASPRLANVGHYFEIPPDTYPPLEQGAVLTRRGSGNTAAREYLKFLQTPAARSIFKEYGFRLPPEAAR